MSIRDRLNRLAGKTRFVVCRIFLHLAGPEVIPLLGVLNQAGRDAIATEGDLETLGESLVRICESLLELRLYWRSAANEGDVFWEAGEAGDYVTELFTDSAQRYLSELPEARSPQDELTLPLTRNVIVMLSLAAEGEVPEIETNLADYEALEAGFQAIINLHYQGRLRAIDVHFSPAQLGEELTDEQLLAYFPELVPL